MNLGVFLSSGSSFCKLAKKGRDELLKSYLIKYCQAFDKVFVFSYDNEKRTDLPSNCYLIANRFNLPRAIYSFFLPFLNRKYLKDCHVLRVMQLTGAIPAILAGKIYHIPVIATYGYDYQKFALIEKKLLSYWFLKFLEPIILKNLNAIITTASFLDKKIRKKTDKPIYLIPNSVNTQLFKPKKKIFNQKRIKILGVARLEKQKNLTKLLKAINLSKYKKNIYLTIIGKGSQKNHLIQLAQRYSLNLKILEGIPYNKMPKFYQETDIFCLVSLIEGHPKALLEALSCGLPCLVSKNQGNLSIIEDKKNGLVTSNKISEIREKIDLLVKDSDLRKKLAKEGRKRAKKDFDRLKLLAREIKIIRKFS